MKSIWSIIIYEQYKHETEYTAGLEGAACASSEDQPDQDGNHSFYRDLDDSLYGM